MLSKGREKVGIKILKNPEGFIDYSQTIDNVYENLEDYNPTKKRRVFIVFHGMIADMESNKKIKSYCYWNVLKGKKAQYSTCFFLTTLLKSA